MSSKDWIEKDFYAVLGVDKAASADDIKKAYRKVARESHPDHNPGDPKAEERFKAASEAYNVLSDTRHVASTTRCARCSARARSGAAPAAGVSPGGMPFDVSDMFGGGGGGGDRRFGGAGFQDLFSSIFTGGQAGGQAAPRGPARGRDVETEVALDFGDAVRGVTLPLTLRAPGVCDTCHGNGAKPGTQPRTCPVCHGAGVTTRNQGSFSFSEPCRNCQGVGTVVEEKCPECHGSGGVTKTRTMNVRFPAGVADGQRIRLAGRGEPGERGGPAGDLLRAGQGPAGRAVRAYRRRPDADRAGHLRGGRARHRPAGAHARRRGDPAGAAGHAERAGAAGPGQGCGPPRRAGR